MILPVGSGSDQANIGNVPQLMSVREKVKKQSHV